MSVATATPELAAARPGLFGFTGSQAVAFAVLLAAVIVLPHVLYPVFLMRVLTAALFACAFNLMIGYVGPAVVRPCRVLRHGRPISRPGR